MTNPDSTFERIKLTH